MHSSFSLGKGPGFVRALLVWSLIFSPLAVSGEAAEEAEAKPEAKSAQDGKPKANVSTRERWLNAAEKTMAAQEEKKKGPARPARQPWYMDDELLARAGIGEETSAEIRETIVKSEVEMKARRAATGTEAGATMREMMELLLSDDFSEKEANELLDQILDQRSLLVRTQLEPKVRIRALLTASQVAALRAERPRFFLEPLTTPNPDIAPESEQDQAAKAQGSQDKSDATD